MSADVPVATLARAAGLEVEWADASGVARRVGDDALGALLVALGWPCGTQAERADSAAALAEKAAAPPCIVTGDANAPLWLPPAVAPRGARFRITLETGGYVDGHVADKRGQRMLPPLATAGYHALDIGTRRVTLAIAPAYGRRFSEARRDRAQDGQWGVVAQLYGLRRHGDSGFGDFTALAMLAAQAARHGAHAVAISPTHALFPALPERDSPYSPSSRRWQNVAYVDCDAVPGVDRAPAPADTSALADAPLIDWPHVMPRKLRALRACFDAWRTHGGGADDEAFRRFRADSGPALDAHARFDALQAFCVDHRIDPDWRRWPMPWRTPDSAEMDAFAHAHASDVTFHAFLQWCASRGLAGAQHAARDAGMAIGLLADLAVGADRAGCDAWVHGAALLRDVSLGAPPDLFNAAGQTWGVTTWTPDALRASGYERFVELLRTAFAHAGGIRIDHVQGLARMWIVPDGAPPCDGAYLRYPCDDLLRLVALEAARHRAIAIGEDLGTVPPGFRKRLAAHGIAGIRTLWFERDAAGEFRAPAAWDRDAVATTSTHDLPTVAGWWRGTDLGWRHAAVDRARDAVPDSSAAAEPCAVSTSAGDAAVRATERAALWRALQHAGCVPYDRDLPPPDAPPVDAVLAYVAQSPSALVMLPLEDLLALDVQPNLPGPPCGHPNWRRRMPRPIDTLFDAGACARIAAVAHARRAKASGA
ncbi:4-alpha-glucanotransferase [Burkholderia multivorans]